MKYLYTVGKFIGSTYTANIRVDITNGSVMDMETSSMVSPVYNIVTKNLFIIRGEFQVIQQYLSLLVNKNNMKNSASSFLIASFTFLLLVGCMKEDDKASVTIAGMYVGETNKVVEWANSMEGHNKRDTLYQDTFWVTLAGQDSIIFSNKGSEWFFMIDTSYNYAEYYGSHSYRMFEFKGNDSLTVDYWTYGGYGPNFNNETIDFIGLKQ